jgi:hypothetical protein
LHISEEELFERYLPFDKPIPYKNLLISPIKLCDMYEVREILGILQVDKNNLGEIAFISMSKLRFLLIAICEEDKYQEQLYQLLYKALSLKDKIIQVYLDDKSEYLMIGKKINQVHGVDIIDEQTAIKITSEDFDEIVRIILYQNVIDYTDKYIDPDVRNAVNEYYRLKNKGATIVPLEHKITCVQLKTGMTREAIGKLTIRNFYQLFDIMVDESDYIAAKTAEFNGVQFKSPIEHWAYKARKDKYAEAFSNADAFIDKIQSV